MAKKNRDDYMARVDNETSDLIDLFIDDYAMNHNLEISKAAMIRKLLRDALAAKGYEVGK
jgi:hypothetical protein